MVELVLVRDYYEKFTSGKLYVNKEFFCNTLEPPNLDNKKNISCIPEGFYALNTEIHPKFGYCLRIPKVKERSGILIHVGNSITDTTGCILAGYHLPEIERGLILSRKTINALYSKCYAYPTTLTIVENLNLRTNQNTNYE